MLEHLLTISIGLGLSAACGFRVFIPPLVASIAAQAGYLELAQEFDWIATTPALIAFSVAVVIEIAAYYIPVIDNLLDAIAGPAAVVAGIVLSASMVSTMSPLTHWAFAIIAGGGAAAAFKSLMAGIRGASTITTAGMGNSVVATAELGGSLITSVLAIIAPAIMLLSCLIVFGVLFRKLRNRANNSTEKTQQA